MPHIPLDTDGSRMAALVASFACLRDQAGTAPFDARTLIHVVLDQDMGDADERVATEFLVWLHVEGLREAGVDLGRSVALTPARFVADRFTLSTVAFYGSPATRAAVAAWLADPFLPVPPHVD